MKIHSLSASKLNVFQTCPRKFWYTYIRDERLPPEDTYPMRLGKFTHLILAKLGASPNLNVETAARQALSELFVPPQLFQEAQVMVQSWYNPGKFANVLAAELPGQMKFQGWTFNYIIDLVQRDGEIIKIKDYKTGRMPWSKEDIVNSYQFMVYTLAAVDLYPGQSKFKLSVDMVALNYEVEVEVGRERVKDFALAVESVAKQVERTPDDPDGVTGAHCFTCPAREICPFFADYLSALHVDSTADLPKAMAGVLERYVDLSNYGRYISNAKDELRRIILTEMEALGEKDATYGEYAVKLTERHGTEYDASLVYSLFGEESFHQSILKVSNTTLSKMLKDLPVEQQELLRRTVKRFPSGIVIQVEKAKQDAG